MIEAEGSFTNYKPSNATNFESSFEISQVNAIPFLYAFKEYLEFNPNPYYYEKNNVAKLKVTSVKDIKNLIIFLNITEAKLLGNKREQYNLFLKKIKNLPKFKNHKIPDNY